MYRYSVNSLIFQAINCPHTLGVAKWVTISVMRGPRLEVEGVEEGALKVGDGGEGD